MGEAHPDRSGLARDRPRKRHRRAPQGFDLFQPFTGSPPNNRKD
jgi:hypothetical protein